MRQNDRDPKKRYFRSAERVCRVNGGWCFITREGDQGPFVTEREARRELARFIMEKKELAHFQAGREARASAIQLEDVAPARKRWLETELKLEPLLI